MARTRLNENIAAVGPIGCRITDWPRSNARRLSTVAKPRPHYEESANLGAGITLRRDKSPTKGKKGMRIPWREPDHDRAPWLDPLQHHWQATTNHPWCRQPRSPSWPHQGKVDRAIPPPLLALCSWRRRYTWLPDRVMLQVLWAV